MKKRNPESVLQDLKKKLEDKKLKEQKPEKPQAKNKNDESKKNRPQRMGRKKMPEVLALRKILSRIQPK